MTQKVDGQIWVSRSRKQQGFFLENTEFYMPSYSLYLPASSYQPQVGDAVSLTYEDGATKINKADTLVHSKIIGIVSRQDQTSQQWEVINIGKAFIPLSKFNSEELGSPNSLIGQTIYLGHGAIDYTFQRYYSSIGGRRIIEVGVVLEVTSSGLWIQIDLGGDSQGPIGTSQVEYTLGMDIPDREGKNPFVMAVAQGGLSQNFQLILEFKNTQPALRYFQAPLVRSGSFVTLFGTAFGVKNQTFVFSSVAHDDFETDEEKVFVITPEQTTRFGVVSAFWKKLTQVLSSFPASVTAMLRIYPTQQIHQLMGSGVENNVLAITPSTTFSFFAQQEYTLVLPQSSVVKTLSEFVDSSDISFTVELEIVAPLGYTGSIEFSPEVGVLTRYQAGVVAQQGTLIIADKKSEQTSMVVGVMLDKKGYSAGEKVYVQKLGTLSGFSNLLAGRKVYLSDSGEVTQSLQEIGMGEWVVLLGVAKDETTIDLNIDNGYYNTPERDEVPIGTVLKVHGLVHGTGIQIYQHDPYYVHCNGAVLYRHHDVYGDSFAPLIDKLAGTNQNSYQLPNLPEQIMKYTTGDINGTGLPVTALRQVIGWKQVSQVVSFQLSGFPANDLFHRFRRPLSELIFQIYVSSSPSDHNSFSISSGFTTITHGSTTKTVGFTLRSNSLGSFQMITKDGLFYLDAGGSLNIVPNSWYIKIVIYEPRILSTFIDITAESRLNYLWEQEENFTQSANLTRNGYMTKQQVGSLLRLLDALNLDENGNPRSGGIDSISIVD